MNMKEVQNFDLLENLRKATENGLTIVQDAIFQAPGKNVDISETYVKLDELEILEKLLEKVQAAKTIEDMRMLLTEDSLPVELVIIDQFWGDFQELIYKLHSKEFEK